MTIRKRLVDTMPMTSHQAPARRRIAQTTDLGDNGPYGGINRLDVVQRIASASLVAGPDRAVAEHVASGLRGEGIAASPVQLTTTHGVTYVCLYQAPDSFKWNVVDQGRVYDTRADSMRQALELVHPFLWSFQELQSDVFADEAGGA